MTVYAKTAGVSNVPGSITPGKLYEIHAEISPGGFRILDDTGYDLFCVWIGCAHLTTDNKNWERVEVEDGPK